MRKEQDRVLIVCGHCGEEEWVKKNRITEPVDAFGDFIDIYYKEQEYERLIRRRDILDEKQQFTELTLVLSLLYDNAIVNAEKAEEEYEKNHDPEDLENAEIWKGMASEFQEREKRLLEQLKMGLIVDAELEENVYAETDENPYAEDSDMDPNQKPKRGTNLDEVLGDTGFLEF
jgi:transcription elongation factor Elf1